MLSLVLSRPMSHSCGFFVVSSGTDSRTIFGWKYRKLLGRGDMLFKPPGKSPSPSARILYLRWWCRTHQTSSRLRRMRDLHESFWPWDVPGKWREISWRRSWRRSAFEEAKAYYQKPRKLALDDSASFVSWFNRATCLMEELEMAGVIGPAEGTKPRKVLK